MNIRADMVKRIGGNLGDIHTAVAEGLKRHGVEIGTAAAGVGGSDFTICWGWRTGKRWHERGKRVLVLERGYIGDRHNWTSIGWNGLNGRADFCLPVGPMWERFNRHFSLSKWTHTGRRVLIMGQVPGDMSLEGRTLDNWYRQAAQEAGKLYDLPVVFRPHPVTMKGKSRPLADDLADAAHVITWNSNSAVDAVLAGVPAVTMDEGAMAWPVSAHRIGEWRRPDRSEWANRLSWCQWSLDELESGVWWDRLKLAITR